MEQKTEILYYNEIESHIESLQVFPLDEIGNLRWFSQHEMVEKLNLQALCEAKQHREEVVCEKFTFFDKSIFLVESLIGHQIWKDHVFPHVLTFIKRCRTQGFPTYMVLYHTVTVASLLETLTFKESFCENLEDSATDLLDFCHSCIGDLIYKKEKQYFKNQILTKSKNGGTTPATPEQLKQQKEDIETILSTKSVGILCHLIQHAKSLPLSVLTRMCDHHDMPVFLAGLIEKNPWTCTDKHHTFKFINGEWRAVAEEDVLCLTQTEGQLWIALHQVLLNPEFTKKYYLSAFRKNRLLRLCPLLNDVLLDQLSALADIQRYLHTLELVDAPMPKRGLILEQLPVIYERFMESYKNRFEELAHRHVELLTSDDGLLKAIAGRMASIYTIDNMEPVLPEPAKCARCGDPATQRCSVCKMEWYCRRQCQVEQWSKHKNVCTALTEIVQKPDQADNATTTFA